jgi:ADP-heptose:LPS heptosyltransferase
MRVLLAKFCGIGGALALTAGLRAVRERHPGVAVTVVTLPGSEPGLEGCPPVVDAVGLDPSAGFWPLLSHLRRQDFDLAIALGNHPAARRLVALSGARRRVCAGRPSWPWRPFFHRQIQAAAVDPHEAARDHETLCQAFGFQAEAPGMWFATSRMQEHGLLLEPGRYAVIHPGSDRPERILEVDKWAVVARELVASRAVDRVVVSAGAEAGDRIMAEALCGLVGPVAVSTGGRLRFSQLARLLHDARLFLGADSPVLQLAAAVGTPVVGVFGPSDYARARAWGTIHRAVRVDTTPYEGEAREDYLRRMDRAMARITAGQVLHAAQEVLRITAD